MNMRKVDGVLGIITAFVLWYAVAFVAGKFLSDEWYFEWYGFPTLMLLAGIVAFGIIIATDALFSLFDDK